MEINPIGFDLISSNNSPLVIKSDGPEILQLENLYLNRIDPEEWNNVVSSALRVLSHCPDPNGQNQTITGLALGKVQSGKTLSYTALIALAIDNGYRITVILAGTKKPLLAQTYGRLNEELNANHNGPILFKNPSSNDFDVISSILYTGDNIILFGLKTKKGIGNIRMLLDEPDLRKYPVLIIDDEGDEASLNTLYRKGKKSAIYGSIENLRRVLPKHAYIAYTATPQANLLISRLDLLSPDFVELIEPGKDYCGGTTYFGIDKNKYVIEVEGSDTAIVHITPDVQRAIATFFVCGAIRSLRNDNSKHSMLIHTSEKKGDHEQLKNAVDNLKKLWIEKTNLPDSDPSSVSFYKTMQTAFKDVNEYLETSVPWEDVKLNLKHQILITQIWMVNSLPIGKDPVADPIHLKNNIFIGGNMLGRGITIPGLAITFITREAKKDTNADTLEQRARWFGYKKSYLDVCKIFLTKRLINRYSGLLQHEDDFWAVLRRNQLQGISIKDWPRMFVLDAETLNLRPTRQQVAGTRKFLGQGWEIQHRLILDEIIAKQNISMINEFIRKHPGHSKFYGKVEHSVVTNLSIDHLINDLLLQINTENTDWEKSYLVEYLQRLYLGKRVNTIEVLYMNKGEYRKRTMSRDGSYNPMQGKSPNRQPGDEDYYPGDEHLHVNNLQLQVHLITAYAFGSTEEVKTSALALYVPDTLEFDLHLIVSENNE